MNRPKTLTSLADELLSALLATPKRQRRLLSHKFWKKFRFNVRTKKRVDAVKTALAERGIRVIEPLDGSFGREPRSGWVLLSLDPTPRSRPCGDEESDTPRPPDEWFTEMAGLDFETEREVEAEFALPLLRKLGYTHDDLVIGRKRRMSEGSSRPPREPDFVLYDGKDRSKGAVLLVVEVKKARRIDTGAVEQAQFYAMNLGAMYYMVTNGYSVRVIENSGVPETHTMVCSATRRTLRTCWAELAAIVGRKAVIRRKYDLIARRGTLGRP